MPNITVKLTGRDGHVMTVSGDLEQVTDSIIWLAKHGELLHFDPVITTTSQRAHSTREYGEDKTYG